MSTERVQSLLWAMALITIVPNTISANGFPAFLVMVLPLAPFCHIL
jgi:hypothetical protein